MVGEVGTVTIGAADPPEDQGPRDREAGTSPVAAIVAVAVVLLMLAVLGGLGYAWFYRSREQARQASCSSNLKSIGLMLLMYSADNGGRLPPAGDWQPPVLPYVKNQQEYTCPGAPAEPGYAYNHRLDSFVVQRISMPAETCLGWDAGAAPLGVTPLPGATASRHLGGDTFVFADGHVRWIEGSEVPSAARTKPSGEQDAPRGYGRADRCGHLSHRVAAHAFPISSHLRCR